mmetsp:Transcript_1865/g.4420  ORF Transcript_1865/g.4420 Transcript_1865/m.4420 type:complete len:215 (+) Transcript_1865:199-843(+)
MLVSVSKMNPVLLKRVTTLDWCSTDTSTNGRSFRIRSGQLKLSRLPRCEHDARRVAVASGRGPSEQEISRMREIASGDLQPSTDVKVKALLDLAKQEWGLYGVKFAEVMEMVNDAYIEMPVEYRTGRGTPEEVVNPPGKNSGSRKIFYLGWSQGLNEQETLRLFCEHYQDVLQNPDGDSHSNIRSFMKHGWGGVWFEGPALMPRGSGAAAPDEV